jgi:hypothetical protein
MTVEAVKTIVVMRVTSIAVTRTTITAAADIATKRVAQIV